MDRGAAYKAIILFGLVSLVGDIIYEGGRAITPTYLGVLGASAFLTGLVFSVGEFISISFRIIGGILADLKKVYWLLYFIGYWLIISIPLIGLANSLWIVSILIIVERLGKAIRSPARDILISIASAGVGSGKAFGLHELLDQVGAVAGPLLMGVALLWTRGGFGTAYSILVIPYVVLVVATLLVYRMLRPRTEELVVGAGRYSLRTGLKELPRSFKIYVLAVTLNVIGLIHWSLILYQSSLFLSASYVAFLYLGLQLVDAFAAPLSGLLYDKYGSSILITPFLLSIIPSTLTLLGGQINVIASALLFGIVFGMQESVYRAAVSSMVGVRLRGTAYGIFNTFYGLGLLISGAIYGFFLSTNLSILGILYTVLVQASAVIFLIHSIKYTYIGGNISGWSP